MAEESKNAGPQVDKKRFNPYVPREFEGATTHRLTTSSHMRRELAKRGEEDSAVYDWQVSKLPEDQRIDVGQARNMILSVYSDAQNSWNHPDRQDFTADQHRALIIEETPEFEELSRKMPRIFLLMTEREVPEEKRQHVLNLIAMQMDQQRRGLSVKQKEAEIAAYAHHHWVRKAKPGEEEEAVAAGTGLRGETVEMPAPAEYQPGGAKYGQNPRGE